MSRQAGRVTINNQQTAALYTNHCSRKLYSYMCLQKLSLKTLHAHKNIMVITWVCAKLLGHDFSCMQCGTKYCVRLCSFGTLVLCISLCSPSGLWYRSNRQVKPVCCEMLIFTEYWITKNTREGEQITQ